jgi:S-adenosylmethionine hydrolase
MARPIAFLSDYGLDDEFVGVCHGVIARIAPDAPVIDLTHGIPPHEVSLGALVLADSVRFMPEGSVYLAVVDPGVGTRRRSVAVETGSGAHLVGPDNGLLSLAWHELGGPVRSVEISSGKVVLEPVSKTFHGRDVFSPAAAHLATGLPLHELGPEVPVGDLVALARPVPAVAQGRVTCTVLAVDRFGNLQLGCASADLERAGLVDRPALDVHTDLASAEARRADTFSDVPPGGLALIVDSRGWLALAVNGGNAAGSLLVGPHDAVTLSSPEGERA